MPLIIALLLFSFIPSLSAAEPHPEVSLVAAIQDIQASKLLDAEEKLSRLVEEVPDFKLAQLVYADVLKSRASGLPVPAIGLESGQQKELLLREVYNRYHGTLSKPSTKIPNVIARVDEHYRHVLVVDLQQSRLYVFDNRNGNPQLIDDFFVSMGRGGAGKVNEGDLKTPLGVYFVQGYIPEINLADKYGAGAYPINYPNAWDRLSGRTGHGIWLHGTRSGTYNRPPLASEGCVVLPNPDLINLASYIDLKSTPVLIGEGIMWLSQQEWRNSQQQINQLHQQWERDWESLNTDDYLRHYSTRFVSGKHDFKQWSQHKRRVSKYKTFVDVELSNVSLLLHPNEDVMVATYQQTYNSDNFSSQSWKRQYWNKEADGQWRIVFEDEISPPVTAQLARNTY